MSGSSPLKIPVTLCFRTASREDRSRRDGETNLRSLLGHKQCEFIELGQYLVNLGEAAPIVICKKTEVRDGKTTNRMICALAVNPSSSIRNVEFQRVSTSYSMYFPGRFMILQTSFQLCLRWGLRLIQTVRMRSFANADCTGTDFPS